jgi:hypothetical protein
MHTRHKPRVFRDPSDGKLKAICTCGWTGDADDIAGHNAPQPKEPRLKKEGFVSGLPESR